MLTVTLRCDAPDGRTETFVLCPLHGELILHTRIADHLTGSGRRDLAAAWHTQAALACR